MNREKLAGLKDVLYGSWSTDAIRVGFMRSLLDALLEEAPDAGPDRRSELALRVTGVEEEARLLVEAQDRQQERLTALEAAPPRDITAKGQWEALLGHADRLTALEMAMAARVAEADAGAARRARVEALHRRLSARRMSMVDVSGLLELLDALLGVPDVGQTHDTERPMPTYHEPLGAMRHAWTARCPVYCMKPAHEWVTEAEVNDPHPVSRAVVLIARAKSHLVGGGDAKRYLDEALTALDPVLRREAHLRGATPCPICLSTICQGDVDARGCETRAATRTARKEEPA